MASTGLIAFGVSTVAFIAFGTAFPRRCGSQRCIGTIMDKLELRIQRDEGGRGIGAIALRGELHRAAMELTHPEIRKIAIITGFPCLLSHTPPTETDGPPGALAIARAALAVGKEVILVTDECNECVVLGAAGASTLCETYGGRFMLESFPGNATFEGADEIRLQNLANNVDMVIAIERAGPSHDGTYRTMRKLDMTHLVAPLDDMILYRLQNEGNHPEARPRLRTIGIGDGGNEVGMGKVYEKILASSINNAKDIACIVPSDHLIVASVSNWGGYALAAAVAVAQYERNVTDKSSRSSRDICDLLSRCLPPPEIEKAILQRMVDCGARDGISGQQELFVDGMPLQASLDVLRELKEIVLE